jgi:integrase
MAKPFRRKSDGQWVVIASLGYKDGKRQRRVFYGKTKREAEEKKADAIAREGGRLRVRSTGTIGEFMTGWLAEVDRGLAPTTAATYRLLWTKHGAPLIRNKRMATFEPDDANNVYRQLAETNVGAATIAKLHCVLHRAFEVARKRRSFFGDNPVGLADPPSYRSPERKPLTLEQAQHFLVTLERSGDRYEAAVVLALACGMREGEVFGLRWGDANWLGKQLSVRRSLQEVSGRFSFSEGKSEHAQRKISLGPVALDALGRRRKIAEHTGPDELIFTTLAGTPVGRTVFRRRHFQPLLKKAGLPMTVRYHDLRHSFATLLLLRGIATKVASEALGHSSPAITQRIYQHVVGDLQGQAMATIDAALRPDTPAMLSAA